MTTKTTKKLAAQCGPPMSLNPTAHQQADINIPGLSFTSTLPEQTTWSEFPEGIEVIHNEPDAIVDICYVHGLAGNRTSAWAVRAQSGFSSKTLLALRLQKTRILTFGYNTHHKSYSQASPNIFVDHALSLLTELIENRLSADASSNPLIFVARGLGDLICKYAMIFSHGSRDNLIRSVYQCLERVIHLGTSNETEAEVTLARGSFWALQLAHYGMFDRFQAVFASLIRTRGGEYQETYVPFEFEMQSTQLLPFADSTNSAGLHMCHNIPSYGNHIDTTKLNEAGDPAVGKFIIDLSASIASICKKLFWYYDVNANHA